MCLTSDTLTRFRFEKVFENTTISEKCCMQCNRKEDYAQNRLLEAHFSMTALLFRKIEMKNVFCQNSAVNALHF